MSPWKGRFQLFQTIMSRFPCEISRECFLFFRHQNWEPWQEKHHSQPRLSLNHHFPPLLATGSALPIRRHLHLWWKLTYSFIQFLSNGKLGIFRRMCNKSYKNYSNDSNTICFGNNLLSKHRWGVWAPVAVRQKTNPRVWYGKIMFTNLSRNATFFWIWF